MFALPRWLTIGYVLGLGVLVVLLLHANPAWAQRAAIAPILGQVQMQMQPSMQLAQQMVMMAGSPMGAQMMSGGMMGMMGMGGMSMMGMSGGMMGMGGGMGGFAGKGMGGFNGKKALYQASRLLRAAATVLPAPAPCAWLVAIVGKQRPERHG
jgi:hypothetical protein